MNHKILMLPAAAAALVITGCGLSTPSVTSTGDAAGSSAPAASPAAAAQTAKVGSTITLSGSSPGEKMAVTVVQVFPTATGADEFNTPDSGKHFYAVQIRLANVGTAAYSDSPSNGAKVTDSAGQSFDSDIFDVSQCQSFPGSEDIAAGGTGLGCIVFQVPTGDTITAFQFALDSGFASQTGQWSLS